MKYVIGNDINNILLDGQSYVEPDGTQYPPEYHKYGLIGLSPITETNPPEFDPALQTAESHIELIDGIYTQVWTVRDLTQAELDALKPPVVPLTVLDFMRRFTIPERLTIWGSADPILGDFIKLLMAAPNVLLTDPDTIAGTTYLATIGVLTEDRKNQILEITK